MRKWSMLSPRQTHHGPIAFVLAFHAAIAAGNRLFQLAFGVIFQHFRDINRSLAIP
jgi:hypothetical protein